MQRWTVGLGMVLLAGGMLIAAVQRQTPVRPNVLLITLDTVRADRLGCYGGAATTSPQIDSLAGAGMLFEHAYAPMPMTRPSHASLFTSQAPRRHGVVYNARVLPAEPATLAEILRQAGYRTAAFVSTPLLDPASGLLRGFDEIAVPAETERPAQDTATAVTAWLTGHTSRRPFFLWAHFFDAHTPYAPPPTFAPDGNTPEAVDLPIASWRLLREVAAAYDGDLPAAYLARARALYEGELRAVDAAVGTIAATLDRQGLLDLTVAVITADHGECFENGVFFQHSSCLYEGAVHVPLIVRYPAAIDRGQRRSDLAQLVDVAPTVLELVGLTPPATFEGLSLLRPAPDRAIIVQHPEPPPDNIARRRREYGGVRSVAGVTAKPWGSGIGELAVIQARWKAILSPDGSAELYDLASDPAETHDLAVAHPARIDAARGHITAWQRGTVHQALDDTDPALRERLRALGY